MNILMILLIVVIWLFSIFAFAKWRIHSNAQKGEIWVSALNDRATNKLVMGTAAILLALIIYLI